jgi:hypothetical protein
MIELHSKKTDQPLRSATVLSPFHTLKGDKTDLSIMVTDGQINMSLDLTSVEALRSIPVKSSVELLQDQIKLVIWRANTFLENAQKQGEKSITLGTLNKKVRQHITPLLRDRGYRVKQSLCNKINSLMLEEEIQVSWD